MAQEQIQDGGKPKKGKAKTFIVIFGMLLLEAALIVGLMSFIAGEPDTASADDQVMLDPQEAEEEKIVEILVLDGKLPNAKTGVTYLYNTEIYVQVKRKHSERVNAELEQFYNEIKAEIGAIWRTSEPHHFQEPKLENLTRKVRTLLTERFGVDGETGEPILVKCVIVMGTGFRVDS